jgi:ABC-type arginine/histidine transport system permease subunit
MEQEIRQHVLCGVAALSLQVLALATTVILGRRLRVRFRKDYRRHMTIAWVIVLISLTALYQMERAASLSKIKYPNLPLFHIHLPLAIALFAALVGGIIFNGVRTKKYHKWVVYSVVVLEVLAVLTGAPLLYQIWQNAST